MADGKRKGDLKICKVCGDHALGSNFNAVTCESCKAFFRRNALKTKDFKCPFSNNCNVDVVTRRFCQKCRLRKCFDIGMKKEWIMSEEEKKAKREKIEKNRKKRSIQGPAEQTQDSLYPKAESPEGHISQVMLSPISSMSPMTPLTPGSVGTTAELPKNSRIFSHQPLTPSDCEYSPPTKVLHLDSALDVDNSTPICKDQESLQYDTDINEDSQFFQPLEREEFSGLNKLSTKLIEESSNHSSIDSLNTSDDVTPTSPGTSADSSASLPLQDKNEELENLSGQAIYSFKTATKSQECEKSRTVRKHSLPMSVYEKAVILEFTELPIRTTDGDSRELTTLEKLKLDELVTANEVLKLPLTCGLSDPSLLDVINMTDHAIRRIIKMSKKISAFKNLCQDDQIALLKGGCTELMILRSVMSYDPEKDCWQGPQGPKIMSIKVEILKEAKGNIYEEHKRFITSFHPNWRCDENIMLLLSGIALFTPERPNTVHKEVIKLEQDTYYYLLRRYLGTIYDYCEAKTTYLRLIHKIQELHILNENHIRVYLEFNPKDVEPLLIEIFDLKH